METEASMENDDPTPRNVRELREEHLFRLIYRAYDNAAFNDLRRPVDWLAVESRLASHPEEIKEWIVTDCCSRTSFVHQFSSFDFGMTAPIQNNLPLPIQCIDGETALRIMNQAIAIYPEALNMYNAMYNGNGCLPIHLVCKRNLHLGNNSQCNQTWTLATESIIHLIYQQCPACFSQLDLTSKTALSLFLDSSCEYAEPDGEEARKRLFDFLLDIFPAACRIPDSDGRYALHVAAHSYSWLEAMQKLLHLYPQAAEVKSHAPWLSTTPLLAVLRCHYGNNSYEIPSMLLDSCPWSAAVDDDKGLLMGQDIDPSGDALDYLCVKYCEIVRVNFSYDELGNDVDDSGWNSIEYRKGFIKANVNFVSPLHNREHDYGSLWDFLIKVLRTMYGRELFLPLHAAVHGRLCRPWNLAVLDGILRKYPDDAKKRDDSENLAIHSFLTSCLVEQQRAIDRFYAGDVDDYHVAVKQALNLLLTAYPEGSRLANGSGRFPIHLAIDTSRSVLAYDVLVEQVLEHAPGTLLERDARTGIYPFITAAIGGRGDLDLTFHLLRLDPLALAAAVAGY
jgi:hypothetical protein